MLYCRPMNRFDYIRQLAQAAKEAMILEVMTAPKPGLVDRYNNGSHRDMTLETFLASARSLTPHFQSFMEMTLAFDEDHFLPYLREPGLVAEQAMYKATQGINTHKGLIFSLGLISCCLLRLAHKLGRPLTQDHEEALRDLIRYNCQGLLKELEVSQPDSHGEAVYLKYGAAGIRQEASLGYPQLFLEALPALKAFKAAYQDEDLPLLLTLATIAGKLEDSNLLKRGGPEGLAWFKDQALARLKLADSGASELQLLASFQAWDEEAMAKNLSPGGAADLLALTIFLDKVFGLKI